MPAEKLFVVVLAAGKSSRFGAVKQLQQYEGKSLAARAVRLGEQVCGSRSILVVGKDWREVAASCAPVRGFLAVNSEYADGISSSIIAGVRAAADVADGVLLMLADQPLVTVAHLRDLVSAWTESPGSIVASAYAGTSGPPVIFPRDKFAKLLTLEGDRGARSLISGASDNVQLIDFPDGALDIDRPGDLPQDY